MKLGLCFSAAALLLTSVSANSAWLVDGDNSKLNFISTKKEHVVEVHKFDRISGQLNDKGEFSTTIDLNSVNTLIPIRNERMKAHLFETDKFATATLSAKLDLSRLNTLKAGETYSDTSEAVLDLHGVKLPIRVSYSVIATSEGGFYVTSNEAILIDSRKFALKAGVDKLLELAGLPSIGYTVPVTFALQLVKQAPAAK